MCEIFAVKGNKKGIRFEQEAMEDALSFNRDGAGYCIFKKLKTGFDLTEIDHFHPDKKPVSYSVTTTKNSTTQHRHKEEVWVDFEIDETTQQLELFGINGTHLYLQYPNGFDAEGFPYLSRIEQEHKVEKWMDSRHMRHDFQLLNSYGITSREVMEASNIGKEKPEEESSEKLTCDTDRIKLAAYLFERQNRLESNELMIIHFRAKTKGTGQINTQPIDTKDFIVMHNGVFTGLGDENLSDTLNFIANMSELYSAGGVAPKNEEKFISAYLEQTVGWWSMFIYSKKTKQLYYFRDGAQFNKFADGILYSTKSERFPIHAEDAPTFAV